MNTRSRRTRLLTLRAVGASVAIGWTLLSAGCGGRSEEGQGRELPGAKVIGHPGDDPGGFIKPRALAGDGRTLWVVDRSGRIQRLDPATGYCLQILRLPQTTLGFPTGLTIAPSPRGDGGMALWVPDTHYHRVLVYAVPPAPAAPTGDRAPSVEALPPEPIATIREYGEGPAQFIYPTSVAVKVAADGRTIERVYVSEYGGHDRVQMFDGSLKPIGSFGRFGEAGAEGPGAEAVFQRPQTVLIDGARQRLIISDSVNHRLGLFSLEGVLQRWVTLDGGPPLKHPRGMRILDDGTVLVAEFGANRVRRLNLETGATMGLWGRPGRGPGELAEPWAIEVMDGRVYVVDAMNHRVQSFRME